MLIKVFGEIINPDLISRIEGYNYKAGDKEYFGVFLYPPSCNDFRYNPCALDIKNITSDEILAEINKEILKTREHRE
jgi:hypothetical protein